MKKTITFISLLFFVCTVLVIPCAYANDDISFWEMPEYLGYALGIIDATQADFVGGILLSLIFILVVLMPTLLLVTKIRNGDVAFYTVLLLSGVMLCFCTAIGWLDAFVLIFCMFGEIVLFAFGVGKLFGSHGAG
jgi:hypothetical protein